MSDQAIYTPPDIVVDADSLQQEAFDSVEAAVDGWTPAEGNLDVIILETTARMAEEVAQLAVDVPSAIITYLGQLLGVTPKPGTAASCDLQVTAQDSNGYTMPSGTQYELTDAAGDAYVFATTAAAAIASGSTQMTVAVAAVDPGAAQSGITPAIGNVTLLDPLYWVSATTQLTTTSGGTDPEDTTSFLDRLTQQLQLMAPRPITPPNFQVMARQVAGVDRVLAIDLYQPAQAANVYGPPIGSAGGVCVPALPATAGTNVARCCTVVCAHADGTACTATELGAVRDLLVSEREVNFLAYAIPPGSQALAIVVHAVAAKGWAVADVQSNLVASLSEAYSPGVWGAPTDGDDPGNWQPQTSFRWSWAVTVAQTTPGVDHIVTLTLNGSQQDVALTSPMNLPAATVTANVDPAP